MVREMVTFLGLGFLIGVVFTLFIGTIMWSSGSISFGQATCPDAKSICPPTAEFLPACATCGVQIVTPTFTLTPTPSDTPTPDLAATATAACTAFGEQFPGTPCPSPDLTSTPTP
jgi:hypothetical protein